MRDTLPAIAPAYHSLFFRYPFLSLQEKTLTEFQLQQLWFEHLLPRQLKASDGKTYQVIQTGWWNHERGPDFRDAVIKDSTGRLFHGDLEFHLHSSDWQSHGHEFDTNYQNLILHLAFQGPEKSIRLIEKSVPTVILSHQLTEPLEQLLKQLPEIASEPLPLTQAASCQTPFLKMKEHQCRLFLQEAGWHRLHLKAERLRRQIQRDGISQTLWENLSETLGYKENKVPFRYLARLYPIDQLRKVPSEERDALLLGASGFLPRIEITNWQKKNRDYAVKLWHRWWKKESLSPKLPQKAWKLAQARPANHPQRRLAALSLLAETFPKILSYFQKLNVASLTDFLFHLNHPFFSFHYTLNSKSSSQPLALLGKSRINDIFMNLVFPWFLSQGVKEAIPLLPPSQNNLLTNLMAQRFFPTSFKPKTALEQQGLIQIFHSFCSKNHCQNCDFPQFLETWHQQTNL